MAEKPTLIKSRLKDGVREISLPSWTSFHNHLEESPHWHLVWRGQKNPSWQLRPTLDRLLWAGKPTSHAGFYNVISRKLRPAYEKHLRTFQLATRGRRGVHPNRELTENDWWALGQHFGLATPLLDWTASPFVAAFFAFADEPSSDGKDRSIWALSTLAATERSAEIAKHSSSSRPPIVEFIHPMSDENPRLVNQGGLFTRGPDGVPIDNWVKKEFAGSIQQTILTRFTIPEAERISCLRMLNKMNINHLSLFPDLTGASSYCNLGLLIEHYSS
ncbi:FRG domain-containing protein [Variovorax sp. J31P179]|uniref:FRG domain-containing protein n=1 Tax=Variovorax sp. J31P179 TaxID=3053508 RepID=UPI002575D7F7|nr:FRG domain-containing protein [Variovorax sp. J31P179]MDM0084583.1 FRG domain-containing protein [Variovorax sp. J31P179]